MRWALPLAMLSFLLVLVANASGLAVGDDGVGYRAIADSLLAGDGLGYFLEDPLTIWPPLWPALMAALAWATPLSTTGAAILLNALVAFAGVLAVNRLLQRTVGDDRLVLLGTVVAAAGSATIGLGHLLMTDASFAVIVVLWLLAWMNYHDTGENKWVAAAVGLVWVGFGLRYVGIYLLGLGGLWLLFDVRRRFSARLTTAVVQGLAGLVVPVAWMLRNNSIDGTFTGERMPSARGWVDNGFDILSTMGRWILPGLLDGSDYLWAAVGGVVLALAAWLGWRVLRVHAAAAGRSPATDLLCWLGRPSGLLAVQAFGYLAYMLYVRSTTALNQLELRLLNPAYFSLLALALVLVDRLSVLGAPGANPTRRRAVTAVHVWAVANVAAGVVAVATFASGNQFFEGNYASDTFEAVRANPALDALPGDCEVYSNLPNALYPRLGPEWSPRRTGLESNERVDDLAELRAELRDGATACLVWIDEPPEYGHLWSLSQLRDRLSVEPLAESGNVAVYRLTSPQA